MICSACGGDRIDYRVRYFQGLRYETATCLGCGSGQATGWSPSGKPTFAVRNTREHTDTLTVGGKRTVRPAPVAEREAE